MGTTEYNYFLLSTHNQGKYTQADNFQIKKEITRDCPQMTLIYTDHY